MIDWNPDLYLKFGKERTLPSKDLISRIGLENPARILDIGCGSGNSTNELKKRWPNAEIIGIDNSSTMIEKAQLLYPEIDFRLMDATEDLSSLGKFDIVFSNAVFHWISNHNALLKEIHKVLKPHGMLVCEFGANNNIATIEQAFIKACKELGYNYASKFNFPTAEMFGELLEDNGFTINSIYEYDRPTVLKDEEQGVENWIRQFYASELSDMSSDTQRKLIHEVEDLTRDKLWNGKAWVADYRRLRAIAHI